VRGRLQEAKPAYADASAAEEGKDAKESSMDDEKHIFFQ